MCKIINIKKGHLFQIGVNQPIIPHDQRQLAIKQRCRIMIEKEWNNKFLSIKPINQ
jgi:hypothetical protein